MRDTLYHLKAPEKGHDNASAEQGRVLPVGPVKRARSLSPAAGHAEAEPGLPPAPPSAAASEEERQLALMEHQLTIREREAALAYEERAMTLREREADLADCRVEKKLKFTMECAYAYQAVSIMQNVDERAKRLFKDTLYNLVSQDSESNVNLDEPVCFRALAAQMGIQLDEPRLRIAHMLAAHAYRAKYGKDPGSA